MLLAFAVVTTPTLLLNTFSSPFVGVCHGWSLSSTSNNFATTGMVSSSRPLFLSSKGGRIPSATTSARPNEGRQHAFAYGTSCPLFMGMTNGDSANGGSNSSSSLLNGDSAGAGGSSSSSGENPSNNKNNNLQKVGQHLLHAAECFQKAGEDCFNGGPHLLCDTGDSLYDLGQAFVDNHWEAASYASDDCRECFYEMSRQSMSHPTLQQAYSAASGDMAGISKIRPEDAFNVDLMKPQFILLSEHLQLASDYYSGKTGTGDNNNNSDGVVGPPIISDCNDVKQLSNLLQEASDTIGILVKELK